MKIEDIEIGKRYVVESEGRWWVVEHTGMVGEEFDFEAVDGFIAVYPKDIPHRVRPYTEIPNRTIEEIAAMHGPERLAHGSEVASNGFETAVRVACLGCGELLNDGNIYQVVEATTGVEYTLFDTESDAISAAKEAGWYVDADKVLCPECRDELTKPDDGIDHKADAYFDRLASEAMEEARNE